MIRFVDPRALEAQAPVPYSLTGDFGAPSVAILANGYLDSDLFGDHLSDALRTVLPSDVARWNKRSTSPAPEGTLVEIAQVATVAICLYGH